MFWDWVRHATQEAPVDGTPIRGMWLTVTRPVNYARWDDAIRGWVDENSELVSNHPPVLWAAYSDGPKEGIHNHTQSPPDDIGKMLGDRRPEWVEYFMDFAQLASRRSTCARRAVGAVAVVGKRVVATGYNGAPKGVPHCTRETCERSKQAIPSGQRAELCRGLHAEQNLIVQAAEHGASIKGATIFSTNKPCVICLKMLINLQVKTIYYLEDYIDPLSDQLAVEAGIDLTKFEVDYG